MDSMQMIKRKGLLPLSFIILLSIWGLGCTTAADPKPARPRGGGVQAVPVAVATVQRQDMPIYLTGLGSVTAFNTVSIKSRVDGQIVQIAFREGQMVNKGDLLVVIDPRPYEIMEHQAEAAQAQAQGALAKDQAQLRDAQLNLKRFSDLASQGVIPPQQRDSQKALVDEVEAAIRADEGAIRVNQAQIENAKLQQTYCHITAPTSGRIGLRLVDEGNIVHASDQNPLLVITQIQPIAVIFTLPEDNLQAVARQMSQGTLQVDAYSRDDQKKLGTGTLLTIDNQIDQTTGTVRLKAQFDNKEGLLWPNQFVNVQLLLEVRKNSTVIPTAAIQRGPQGISYVYVVKANKTVDVRSVSVAITQGAMAAIESGITPGEVVVTDGQDKLQADSKVELRSANAMEKIPAQAPGSTT
jgi:multidrug efflux system membrane fusion protein